MFSRNTVVPFIKYGIVGLINTLITLAVIWLMLHFVFGVSGSEKATTFENTVSNIAGFAAGLINSFIFNRKSHTFDYFYPQGSAVRAAMDKKQTIYKDSKVMLRK